MPVTLKSRKPIHLLTLADLDAFPVWEYCDDEEDVPGQDETWVRPLGGSTIPRGRYSLTVASEFKTASGKAFRGFAGVTTVEKLPEVCQGVILNGEQSYLFIPNPEASDYAKAKQELAAGLGLAASAVFPISYALSVPLSGEKECRSGLLP